MTELAKLEIFLRGGAIATLLFCAAVFASHGSLNRKDGSVAALCLGLCAYMLVSSPSIGIETGPVFTALVAISAMVPVLVYWTALELFQDNPIIARWQLFICGLIIASAWLSLTSISLGVVRGAGALVIFAHLVAVIILGHEDDLIETRRRFRRWFLLAVACVAIFITVLEVTGADRRLSVVFYLVHALVFWGLAAAFLFWAVRADPAIWLERRQNAATKNDISPAQRALIGRINAAMSEKLWEREGLTLSEMAQALDTQEHRLRSAINQGMGHRNFSSFINGYRIARAKELLSNPSFAERTVLSVAYDVGFASLGPFNRAFREATGQTPTEFRHAALRVSESSNAS